MTERPKKMLAAILVEQNRPLVIDEIELPDHLSYGQVLVKVVCSGICGSQIGEIDGVKGPDKFLPHLLGHEGGGIIQEVGPGVTRVKNGDHVVMHWMKGWGVESSTPKYRWGARTVNAGWVTTFNEYAVVSENRLTPVPDEIDFEVAALMGCAVTTGFGVVNNNARLKIGESIAVFGSGGIGLNIIQAAALVSGHPIIAIDIHDHKLELARGFGATHVINSSKMDVKEEIFRIVGTKGVDVAVDNTGNVTVIENAYEVTCSDGRTVLVGVPRAGEKISIYSLPLHFEKSLSGSHGGESRPSIDIQNYLKLVNAGRLNFRDMVTHRFALANINEAIDRMRTGEIVRCIVNINSKKG